MIYVCGVVCVNPYITHTHFYSFKGVLCSSKNKLAHISMDGIQAVLKERIEAQKNMLCIGSSFKVWSWDVWRSFR